MIGNIEISTIKDGKKRVITRALELYPGIAADIAEKYRASGFTVLSIRIF